MDSVKWPTTLIIVSIIFSVTALGWNGSIESDAVASILGGISAGVLTGHYVKTTLNGSSQPPPGSTTTTVVPSRTETTTSHTSEGP